jgi:hypothetical protein
MATGALLEGDVLVTRSRTAVSALAAYHPVHQGPYNHAGVFVRNHAGEPMLLQVDERGCQLTPLERILEDLILVRVLRHTDVNADANPVAEPARKARDSRKAIRSVYTSDSTVSINCIGFVNKLYTDAGLDAPFSPHMDNLVAFAGDWYLHRIDTPLSAIASPNSALSNPRFKTVADWDNTLDGWLETERVIAERTVNALAQGADIRRPPLFYRMQIALITIGRGKEGLQSLADLVTQYKRMRKRIRKDVERYDDLAPVGEMTGILFSRLQNEFFENTSSEDPARKRRPLK